MIRQSSTNFGLVGKRKSSTLDNGTDVAIGYIDGLASVNAYHATVNTAHYYHRKFIDRIYNIINNIFVGTWRRWDYRFVKNH